MRLKAKAVSRGIAIGRAVCLFGNDRQYYRIDIPEKKVESELRRFRAAVRLSGRQLKKLIGADNHKHSATGVEIFETHKMILEDSAFISKIENTIQERLTNAEWAVKLVTDEYVSRFKELDDEHFRDRFVDLEDVSQRITNALGGGHRVKVRLDDDAIIVAKELRPSTLVELYEGAPAGLITEHGGWTSHSFILAREVNIPAVTGLKKILRRLDTGDRVIVDGFAGQVILNPSDETVREYRHEAKRTRPIEIPTDARSSQPLKTLDGREITIRANADLPTVYRRSTQFGVKGIGLFRSEFLFNRFGGFPTEKQQYEAYRRLAAVVGDDGVKIRTFDIGAGQLVDRNDDRERNPALGLRAVRLSLAYPKQLRVQFRAILRAAHNCSVDIVIPMVSSVAEIRDVKAILEHERDRLERSGIECGDPGLGAMIEVPAAVLIADNILAETDFVCLGTNDLIQYLLAVDRDNETVANWYRTLHPAVLKAIGIVVEAAESANKPAILCGEMAASPFYVPVLVGLGVRELSMNVNAIPGVRRLIAGIAYEEAVGLVETISTFRTTLDVENTVRKTIVEKWAHLYPPEFLDIRRH
ncbi:MAG: phosphoenolpyruvate--protein phosphotransferase [Pyrinomonadaceae bacterium]|nr:phosphoenolpyruvate--protein phosphotransferase [Pyrinomonadaceae bacterium]